MHLTHSWRALRRAPVFSAAVVLSLTIGIGAAAAIFAVVNAVLLRPLPYGNADRLVGAWHNMPAVSMVHAQQTTSTYYTYRRMATTVEGIAMYDDGSINVTDADGKADPERMRTGWSTANLFQVLRVSTILGRTFSEQEDAPKAETKVVVISEALWKSRFGGSRDVLAKKLTISGRAYDIIGVMPASFGFPTAETRLWLPENADPSDPEQGGFNHYAIARLKPGITVDAAQRDFANVLPRINDLYPMFAPNVATKMVMDQAKPTPLLVPMKDDVVSDVSKTLWMVAATAILVLIVTCANVANLLLVRADGRYRELSVRAALGAGQRRILAHFFTEAALLACVSAALGLGVAAIAIRLLVRAGPVEIPRLSEVGVDGAVVAFTVVVAFIVAIACSAFPAIRFVRSDLLGGLRDGGRGGTAGGRRQRARSALVSAQVALALVVLTTSGLLMKSFSRLGAVRPGFNPDGVTTLWVSLTQQRYPTNESVMQFYQELSRRAALIPGVQSVGLTSRVPLIMDGMNQNPLYVEGDASNDKRIPPLNIYVTTDSGYFKTMSIPLIAGRMFASLDRQQLQGKDDALISQEAARFFYHDSTGQAALGKRFRVLPNGVWHTVIGVVGSMRDTALTAPPTRVVYFPQAVSDETVGQFHRTLAITARAHGTDLGPTTRALQSLIHEMDPTMPTFGVRSVRDAMQASTARLSFTMIILGVAAAVTLVLGVIGLYGVIAYVVALRTRELGVRIALGAQPSAVAAMVTKQGLMLSASGVAIGLVLVILSGRFIRSLLFEVAPTDIVTLASASGLLLGFALLASWIPARRAARVNPTEALRAD
ncbi:MAG TPA: ABC transporter permease [Gemmatimonadaceae bacterium]|jgi:predicted permease